jgi:CBS domain-containing protein
MQVRQIMESDVPTVTPEQPVEDAVRLLREHDLPGVPVVNGGGRCVGIITLHGVR